MKERTETIAIFGLLAYFGILFAVADEKKIEDLGVITPTIGKILEHTTGRSDVSHFVLEFYPETPPTNIVKITKTNDLLTLDDLGQLPSGRMVMGLASQFSDGTVSPLKLYRLEVWRAEATAPRARSTFLATTNAEPVHSLTNALRNRVTAVPPPPLPSMRLIGDGSPIPPAGEWPTNPPTVRALPQGTNKSYAEHLDSMARHYSRPGRRNER
jgi:hypothetical protein